MKLKNNKRGFTLVEMLMYVVIMTLVGLVIASFVPQLIKSNSYIQAKSEVLDNTRRALDTMAQEIRQSSEIYTPTSVFDAHPGQLSLRTTLNPVAGEESTYVDFYVDDDRLYVKKEEQSAALLMSEKIKIENLVFTHLGPDTDYPAVRITMTAFYGSPSSEVAAQSKVTLSSTISLRSY